MNQTRWAKISEIIEQALEKTDATERSAYLTQVCGEDTGLREEIESLLAFEDGDATNVFENNQPNKLFFAEYDKATQNYIGKQIGKYKTVELLGEGGMGAVFLADRTDGEFDQQVAIKLLKQGFVSQMALSRFVSERQILARLHHRFIAQLLDGGTTDEGLPYLVMEYIEGLPLLEYCDKHNLDLKARLEIFQKICSAVQYAHQHLVIHRDLKPSNIMVADDGSPKLLDFGISKLIAQEGDTQQTQTEFRALTPAYASPEQIKGATISTTTDVYSLGIILYELLTGKRPYDTDSKNFSEIIKAICEEEPLIPSKSFNSSKSLKGDLDNIILTALRKEPSRRYQSAEDLSKDISNYLNGLPVAARPNTFTYRASKFYQRNKTASIIGAFLALSLILGIIATTWQSVIANRERDRAEKRFQDVRKLSNSLLFEITPKIERLQGSTEAREILVKRALEYLDSLAADANNDLTLQAELALAYEKIGELQGNSSRPNLGDFTGATESFLKARQIRQSLPQTVENQSLLAENYRILADIRFEQSETEKAFQETESAINIYRELVSKNPDSKEFQTSYLKTLIDLGQLYQFTWKMDKSIEVSKQVKQEIEKLNPTEKEAQEIIMTNLTDLGYSLSWNNQQTEAETEMAKAVEMAEKLAINFPNDARTQRVVWRTFIQSSGIYESIKDDISLKFAQKALNAAIVASQNDSADFQAKQNLVRSHYRVGICLSNLKKFDEAIFNLQTAEKLLRELIEREPKNRVYQVELARIFTTSGDTKIKMNKLDEALKLFQDSAQIRETILQSDANNANAFRDLAIALKNIGDINSKLGEKDKAKLNYGRTLEILTQLKNNNTLSEFDNKLLEEVKNKLAGF